MTSADRFPRLHNLSGKHLCYAAMALLAVLLAGCSSPRPDRDEQKLVKAQQLIYAVVQPIHKYDYSLSRGQWLDFYDANNKVVTTFAYIMPRLGGAPEFECAAVSYALPRDTQLTNSMQTVGNGAYAYVLPQPEPNGLFTSLHTDATVVFCSNPDGTAAPVYTEQKVTIFPFPVKWMGNAQGDGQFVKVGDSSVQIVVHK